MSSVPASLTAAKDRLFGAGGCIFIVLVASAVYLAAAARTCDRSNYCEKVSYRLLPESQSILPRLRHVLGKWMGSRMQCNLLPDLRGDVGLDEVSFANLQHGRWARSGHFSAPFKAATDFLFACTSCLVAVGIFLSLWWAAGTGYGTFEGPFTTSGNGYFAGWIAALVSIRLAFVTMSQARLRLKRLETCRMMLSASAACTCQWFRQVHQQRLLVCVGRFVRCHFSHFV